MNELDLFLISDHTTVPEDMNISFLRCYDSTNICPSNDLEPSKLTVEDLRANLICFAFTVIVHVGDKNR